MGTALVFGQCGESHCTRRQGQGGGGRGMSGCLEAREWPCGSPPACRQAREVGYVTHPHPPELLESKDNEGRLTAPYFPGPAAHQAGAALPASPPLIPWDGVARGCPHAYPAGGTQKQAGEQVGGQAGMQLRSAPLGHLPAMGTGK